MTFLSKIEHETLLYLYYIEKIRPKSEAKFFFVIFYVWKPELVCFHFKLQAYNISNFILHDIRALRLGKIVPWNCNQENWSAFWRTNFGSETDFMPRSSKLRKVSWKKLSQSLVIGLSMEPPFGLNYELSSPMDGVG